MVHTGTRGPKSDLGRMLLAETEPTKRQGKSVAAARSARASSHPLHQLQRRIGNRAVGRLIRGTFSIGLSEDVACKGGSACNCKVCAHSGPGRRPIAAGTDDRDEQLSRAVSGGTSLPSGTRHLFESRFGRDFSKVRVHNDASANSTAGRLGAAAFAEGTNIYFAAGRYEPSTTAGRWILAHELAHVAQ